MSLGEFHVSKLKMAILIFNFSKKKKNIKTWKLKTNFWFKDENEKLKIKNENERKGFNVVEGSEKKSKNFGKKLDYFSIFNFKIKIENWRQNSIFKLKPNWVLEKLHFSNQF